MNYLKEAVILSLGLYLNLLCRRVSGGQISGKGVVNLGHRQSKWTPLMQTSANLSDITSIRSFFEFRTFDPEGAIFYGDTKEGLDWFVLSLRDGIPEMQIGKADILVSIKGGHKLNDGAWHLLELRSEGKFVVLEVNNKAELVVGLHSKLTEEELTGKIRLAVGGMLVDKQTLFHPFQPEMDACIRGGHWLNLSTPWDTDSTWEPRPCFSQIKRGSYFPGTGVAVFNTSELPGLQTEEAGITIEIFGSWTGTALSLQSTGFQYISKELDGHKDEKEVQLGLKEGSETFDLPREPATLTFTILKHSLVVNSKSELEAESLDFFTMWKKGMLLTFGGIPGDSEATKSTHHLRGCLEKILVQGQVIDLDRALYKHTAVSSHSCPTEPINELT
ncbi:sex hormone-binding globulin [Pimephales promelas]|uniref:sex hormone-binding globulin n=1 Tax=Pimephales promelas TaxID=90988 RepID=UPI001955A948|nr:sex hormone-binding globulin [Pimephales promelas]KAG1931769.1 growth arrest-specific protein [Pimephales promelas]